MSYALVVFDITDEILYTLHWEKKGLFKFFFNSPINFQITLSTYKLDPQNKNYIYKIKIQIFILLQNTK